MAANLDVKDYDGDHYYMWDAKKQYWDGWEWTKNLPDGQPTLNTNSSNNYPQSNSDPRYYNNSYSGFGVRNDAQTTLFKTLPNVNEIYWYVQHGEPHWDNTELWATMGHLYVGGMWFKKLSAIGAAQSPSKTVADLKAASPDGVDYTRITSRAIYSNNSVTPGKPSNLNDYFYLPALGTYMDGTLYSVGTFSYYWSSTPYPLESSLSSAYSLLFYSGYINVEGRSRSYGFRLWTAQ